MNTTISTILLFGSAMFLTVSQGLTSKVSEEQLFERSDLWPEKLAIQVEVVGKMHGNRVKPGQAGVFLGIKDGRCLVDLGHNGIFALPVSDTDLLERVGDPKNGRKPGDRGLFASRYAKSFVWPQRRQPCSLDAFDAKDYFLIVRMRSGTNEVSEAERAFYERLRGAEFEELRVQPLLVPYNRVDRAFLEPRREELRGLPVMAEFLKPGFLHVNAHLLSAEPRNQAVLVDANGKHIGDIRSLTWATMIDLRDVLRSQVLSD